MNRVAPAVSGMSRSGIDREAEAYLRRHFPERLVEPGPTDVLEFFDSILPFEYHLVTGVDDLDPRYEGIMTLNLDILVNEDTYRGVVRGEGRPRFTMAHECYHGLKHGKQFVRAVEMVGLPRLMAKPRVAHFENPEWQANYFAGAFLMPLPMVVEVLGGSAGLWGTHTLAEAFCVTPSAAEVRIKTLTEQGVLR